MSLNTTHLARCIQTLESALSLLKKAPLDSIDYEIFCNAVVKGFELWLETAGKILQRALKAYGASARSVDELSHADT